MTKSDRHQDRIQDDARRLPTPLPEGIFSPDETVPHYFNVVTNRVSATLQHMYSEQFGLTVSGWRALAILGKRAPLSAKELGEYTAMDQVSISRSVDHLVKLGYVARDVDLADRRRVALSLTEQGNYVYDRVVPILYASEQALIADFSDSEIALFRRMCQTVAARSAEFLPAGGSWETLVEQFGYHHEIDK